MSIRVMGLTSGRKESNSEILLKEALIACEKEGAEVIMVNLRDYHIQHCTGCASCMIGMYQGRNVGCVQDGRDDKKRIMDVMFEQDAVICSVPTYDLMPSAEYLTFAQRNLSYEPLLLERAGALERRDSVAGLISVGSDSRSWQSMALEAMQASMLHLDMKVVDMMVADHLPGPAQVLLREDLIARARRLGENIMTAVKTPVSSRTWLGDTDMGWCPNCHCGALVLGEAGADGTGYQVECQVCGAGGTLELTEDGKWRFVIARDGLRKDRMTSQGRALHMDEVARVRNALFADPENREVIARRMARYKNKQFNGISEE